MKKSNMLTVNIPNTDLPLTYFDYNKDLLYDLREAYNDTHAFFRHRINDNDVIVVFPVCSNSSITIEGAIDFTINPCADMYLAKKFVHELIFRKVINSGAKVEKYTSIKFLSRKQTDNELSQILSQDIKIGFKKGFDISTRIFFADNTPQIFIPIDVFYRWDIDITCKDLINKGIDLSNIYVCENQQSSFSLLSDRRMLIGKIKEINTDGTCIIEKDGTTTIKQTNELYIENNITNRNTIIKAFLGFSQYNKCIENINNKTGERKNAKSKMNSINPLFSWLSKDSISNDCGFEFKITNFYDETNTCWKSKILNNPTFIYDLHETKTSLNSDKGLKEFGPFDKDIFEKKSPSIAVLCLKQDRGTVTEFINKLIQGLPKISCGNLLPYGNGFKDKYHLSNIDVLVFEIENTSLEAYSKTISQCLSYDVTFDLAIVQSSIKFKDYHYTESPYLLAKSKFMSSDIPVQEINIETMKKPDKNLAWILNNIALASYSKMGGNPWVIPSNKSIDRELIIGLGSAVFKNGRFKNDKRIIGITTVFNSDGTYLLSNKSKEVKFENYFEELKDNLKRIFSDVIKSEGWVSGDNIRLVFHCFKPFKSNEIAAIKTLVNELCKEYTVLFAFIHVENFQKIFWIDDANNGDTSYSGIKGEWMPDKGSILKLDKYNCLIQLTGSKDIKMASHGMARPICLSLHRESTFIDLDYLSQQLYFFTFMSYRSFSSSPLPVTIWYSQLIAKLLGGLSFLPQWDSDVMNNKLKYSRWFL